MVNSFHLFLIFSIIFSMLNYLFKSTSFTFHFYKTWSYSWYLFLLLFYGGLICKYVRNDLNILRFAEVCFVALWSDQFFSSFHVLLKRIHVSFIAWNVLCFYEPVNLQHNLDNNFFGQVLAQNIFLDITGGIDVSYYYCVRI